MSVPQIVTDVLGSVPPPLAYVAVGAAVFVEAALFVGFVVPGESAVLVGGLLAATGHLSVVLLAAVVVAVAGRFTAVLRALTPALAGMSGMPYRRFLVWNAAGGVLWGAGVTLLGYLAGRSLPLVERSLGGFGLLVVAGFVAVGLVAWRRRRVARFG